MNEEASLQTSQPPVTLSGREQLLKKLHKSIALRTSAITKDLQVFEAYSTLLLQSGPGPRSSTTGGVLRGVARRGGPMNSGIASNQSVQAKALSGGTATLGKRSSSSTTSARETSASATYSSGPTGGTSTGKSKGARLA